MENSVNQLMMTKSSSKAETEESSPEESSWTFYIQDFPCGNLNENNDFVSLSSSSSNNNNQANASLLSDAASSASKKANNNYKYGIENFNISSEKNTCNDKATMMMMMMMTFRKKGIIQRAAEMDEDLQDTASSPVNSPKISHVNEFQMKQKEMAGISFGQVMKRDDVSGALVVEGEGDDNITELKKRGLCLVPISSVAKYYGLN